MITFLEEVKKKINNKLNPEQILLIDNSSLHSKHKSFDVNKYHLKIIIESEKLKKMDKITVHRKVFSILKDEMKKKIHALVIPKGKYISFADFSKNGSKDEIEGFFKVVGKVAEDLNLVEGGYRLLANHGVNAGQEVPHFHIHIFGGQQLGPMISKN